MMSRPKRSQLHCPIHWPSPLKVLKSESGIALMIAIFAMTLMMVIATEVMYQTNVELLVSSQAVNQVKAHYAAKAGVAISLLRIQIYRKAAALAGSALPPGKLEMIWKMPFAWPPVVTGAASLVDQDQIKSAVKKSSMQSSYFTTIESEGSKIDINDLDSPSKAIADATKTQLVQLFEAKMKDDEIFAARNRGIDFGKLIDSIADWISVGQNARSGGLKSQFYPERTNDFIPPGQAFKTLSELHMVSGMTDDIYDFLEPLVTVYGSHSINVNFATKEVLKSLTPQITDERADKILKARESEERGPFKDLKDFTDFIGTLGIASDTLVDKDGKALLPLSFGIEYNFRIHSTGRSGRVDKEIIAIVFDVDQAKSQIKDQLKPGAESPTPAPAQDAKGSSTSTTTAAPAPSPSPSPSSSTMPKNEQPNIVYWNET
jgi:general secretion pathway protein K